MACGIQLMILLNLMNPLVNCVKLLQRVGYCNNQTDYINQRVIIFLFDGAAEPNFSLLLFQTKPDSPACYYHTPNVILKFRGIASFIRKFDLNIQESSPTCMDSLNCVIASNFCLIWENIGNLSGLRFLN